MKINFENSDSPTHVEAARYALLRRLAPALRHGMVGSLQPIELIAEAIERRLQSAQPDLASVLDNIGKIKQLSRSAAHSCANLAAWLSPGENAPVMLGEAIDECMALLHTDFEMRGFIMVDETRDTGVDVPCAALRQVLTAALIAATDAAPQPADLVLRVALNGMHAELSILVRPSPDRDGNCFARGAAYRTVGWDDVRALARAESVDLLCEEGRITMRYPLIQAAPCPP